MNALHIIQQALFKLLIKKGAKIDIKNNEGKTPLDLAKELKYKDIIDLLN